MTNTQAFILYLAAFLGAPFMAGFGCQMGKQWMSPAPIHHAAASAAPAPADAALDETVGDGMMILCDEKTTLPRARAMVRALQRIQGGEVWPDHPPVAGPPSPQ